MALPPILDMTVIEKAAEGLVVAQVAAIRQAAVQKESGGILFSNPAIAVSIFETGKWVKEGKYAYKVPFSLNVLLTFYHPGDEELRRKGINPLVFLIIQALVQQKLDLDLTDTGLEPERFRDVSDSEDITNKKCVYLLEFSGGFYFKVPKDCEAMADLIGVAVNYLLEPSGYGFADQDELTM